jgi:hypothetical protein
MDGGLLIKEKPITLTLIIFTFLCFFFLSTKAQAGVYCVGCSGATAATCTGGAACAGFCTGGTNGVVCSDIADALDCIDQNDDINATIRIAQNPTMPLTPYTGPGSTNPIDNTATMADQTINILGGWTATTCANQTVNPTNTVVQAPMTDRVFLINNTTANLLTVTLEGLTITGGNPDTELCGSGSLTNKNGAGVCATSTSGMGGLNFTSMSNIYDDNDATSSGAGGGLAVIAGGGGDIVFESGMEMGGGDTFTNNNALSNGGGIFLGATSAMLDATIHNATIGGDNPFPMGGNAALAFGGGIGILNVGDGMLVVLNQGNEVTNNTATFGGGISIINSSALQPLTVSLEQDIITFNVSSASGGGIYIAPSFNSTSTVNASISKTEIGNNQAGTFGGGIALTDIGNINLNPVVNNVIHNNIALGSPAGGGGVAAVTTAASSDYDIKFVNNTISDNQAPTTGAMGGGIFADSSAASAAGTINWTLPNDIIFFNSAAGDGEQVALANTGDNATIVLRFTDISNAMGDIVGTDVGGVGGVGFVNLVNPNIFTDPQFVDRFNNNYHPQPTSPAVDAGTNTAILTVAGVEADPPSDDFAGQPRGMNPTIGALEPLAPPTPTPTPTATPTPSPTPTPTPTPTFTPTPTPTIPPPTPTPTPQNMLIFPNSRNGKIVTIESELGTTLQGGPLGKTLEGCPEVFNDQFLTFPVGAYEYFITGLNPGDATTVVIELPPGTVVNSYFKFGKTPDNDQDHCYEFLFDGVTGAQIMNGTIVVHHVDGERGDDDLTPNGVIVDPAAPGFLSDEPPPPDTGNRNGCSLASTVNSGSAVLNLFIPLIPVIAVGIRYLGRRRRM